MSRIALLHVPAPSHHASAVPAADDVPPNKQYLAFIRKQAAELRKNDKPPATADEWAKQEAELRKNLFAAWGGRRASSKTPCDLDPQQHGEPLKRDGYTVEKITIQTRPGVRMTANLYVPDAAKKKKAPAILMVHGHWQGAKQDPVVQSRCIGAAKLGFVVLCVDAFGAGERGIGTQLGEYHGDMTAATLLPLGTPLSGLQVYENMRAVDYLETRPEVDKRARSASPARAAAATRRCTPARGTSASSASCRSARSATIRRICGPRAACARWFPGRCKFTEEWARARPGRTARRSWS